MELLGSTSRGGFSVRGIFTFVLVVFITTLLWVILGGQPVHAADASWSGESIIYDGHAFNKTTDFKDLSNTIPSGATVFQSPVQNGTPPASERIFIIYFSSGVDPPTAQTARYVEFDYSSNSELSKPSNAKDITLTPKGQEEELSSCSVGGIGWIICPLSVFLAEAMDYVFGILAGMIEVQPSVIGDPNDGMYTAWSVMRSIANIAFVIVFLIIIYSQLTNIGISNYGLKKLLPRLIIAAVLVNLSFIISAVAIDVSNILGYSIQDVFNTIRENTFHVTNDNFAGVNENPWSTITGVILAGGGAYGAYFAAGSAGGALYLLIPLLLGLILTLIFVVIILAARQAIIIILVIIAPLAFVLNLLPNTEKWFKQWMDLFFTMLIFFPAFSVVFGGSQLAGQLIIQNANGNIITVLFGMAVQIAPLVITPLLLRLSGNLLGKIGQIVNNPRKGLMDRTGNWAKSRAEMQRQNNMGKQTSWKNPLSYGRKSLQFFDDSAKKTNDRTEIYKLRADNRYHKSKAYGKIHELEADAELERDTIHNRHATHVERLKTNPNSNLYNRAINAQSSKEGLESAQNETNTHFNRQRTIAGTALNSTSNYLEYSKMRLETSEGEKTVYQTRQKLTSGTLLNGAVEGLETSKVRVEAKQTQYTKMVEDMKLNRGSTMYTAAQNAQASKELLESSQAKVQTVFDQQRRVQGTSLNLSSMELENSNILAEAAKAQFASYVASSKSQRGTTLHENVMNTENIKQTQQVFESGLNRMLEEYRSGSVDTTVLTTNEASIMQEMVRNTEQAAAEAQGIQAAQNMQKERIATAFTETYVNAAGNKVKTSRAEDLLKIAKSVDPYGDVRAEATAFSTITEIRGKARTANETLLQAQAEETGKFPKDYAVELLEARIAGDTSQSEDFIRAAMEVAAREAQIPVLRKMRMSSNFNQDHLSETLLRNSGTMKEKGGFDLQANMDLIGASTEIMDASIASTMGSVSGKGYITLKNSTFKDYVARFKSEIIPNTKKMATSTDPTEANFGANGVMGLKNTYFQLHAALTDPEIVSELGDNLIPSIDMFKMLHAEFGTKPIPNIDDLDPRKV